MNRLFLKTRIIKRLRDATEFYLTSKRFLPQCFNFESIKYAVKKTLFSNNLTRQEHPTLFWSIEGYKENSGQ